MELARDGVAETSSAQDADIYRMTKRRVQYYFQGTCNIAVHNDVNTRYISLSVTSS